MVGFCAKVSMLFGRSRVWAVRNEVPRTKDSDQNKHGDPSDAKAMYNGCTRDVQGMYNGYPREQRAHNTGATPEQCRGNTLASRLCCACSALAPSAALGIPSGPSERSIPTRTLFLHVAHETLPWAATGRPCDFSEISRLTAARFSGKVPLRF